MAHFAVAIWDSQNIIEGFPGNGSGRQMTFTNFQLINQ